MDPAYGSRLRRARRRRRRRAAIMWLFGLCTLAALVTVGWVVLRLDRFASRPAVAVPVAMSRIRVIVPAVHDGTTGLSYVLLGPPWHAGCPAALSSGGFTWTAGEAAVAGYPRIAGQRVTWHGFACSGPLPPSLRRVQPRAAARAALDALAPGYYGGLRHVLTVTASRALRVGERTAWLIAFRVSYADRHLPWRYEDGAVAVTGSGIYYVSVPGNLGTWTYRALVASLR